MTSGSKAIYPTLASLSPIYKASNHPGLKALNRISSFSVSFKPRYMAPGTIVLLLGNMPQVDRLDLEPYDNDRKTNHIYASSCD